MLFKNTGLFFSRAGMSHYPGSGAGRRVSEGHPAARCNSDCTNSRARSSVWEGDTTAATPEPASRRDFPRVKVVGRSQLAHINRPPPPPHEPPRKSHQSVQATDLGGLPSSVRCNKKKKKRRTQVTGWHGAGDDER